MHCSLRGTQTRPRRRCIACLPSCKSASPLLSPMNYLKDIHAPLIVLLHDRGDQVIPVGESRRLYSALAGHAGVHYTEMQFSAPGSGQREAAIVFALFGSSASSFSPCTQCSGKR